MHPRCSPDRPMDKPTGPAWVSLPEWHHLDRSWPVLGLICLHIYRDNTTERDTTRSTEMARYWEGEGATGPRTVYRHIGGESREYRGTIGDFDGAEAIDIVREMVYTGKIIATSS